MLDALKDAVNQADIALARSQAGGGRFFAAATAVSLPDLTAPEAVVFAALIVPNTNSRPVTFFLTLQIADSASDFVSIVVSVIQNPTSVSGGVTLSDGITVDNGGAPVVVNGSAPIVVETLSWVTPGGSDTRTIQYSFGIPADLGFTFAITASHNLTAMLMNLTVSQQG